MFISDKYVKKNFENFRFHCHHYYENFLLFSFFFGRGFILSNRSKRSKRDRTLELFDRYISQAKTYVEGATL